MGSCRIGNGTRLAVGRRRTNMDDQAVKPETRPIEEPSSASRSPLPGAIEPKPAGRIDQREATTEAKRVEIVLRVERVGVERSEPANPGEESLTQIPALIIAQRLS